MIVVQVDQARCDGCEDCVDQCPTDVFDMVNGKAHGSRNDDCMACKLCETVCPQMAIVVQE